MNLVILGAGGYGRTIADVARQSGKYDVIRLLDDAGESKCTNYVDYKDTDTEFYPAFSNNEARMDWRYRLIESDCNLPVIIHPTAYVSPGVKLHPGTVVLPHAVVDTGCVIRMGSIVNCGAIVDHDCILEEGVHVCLGAIVKAENCIPRCVKIEAGQVVNNRTYSLDGGSYAV